MCLAGKTTKANNEKHQPRRRPTQGQHRADASTSTHSPHTSTTKERRDEKAQRGEEENVPQKSLKVGGDWTRLSRRATAGQSRSTGLQAPAGQSRLARTNPGSAVGGEACTLHCLFGDGRLVSSVWALSQTLQTRTRKTLWLTSLRRRELHHERRDDTSWHDRASKTVVQVANTW